jgi:predicted nuclease with TOPRIM domain
MGYDEEPLDPHGECRHEIADLTAEVERLIQSRRAWMTNYHTLKDRVAELEAVVEKADALAAYAIVSRRTKEYDEARAALGEGGK